jgi:hypothetical protein
MRIQPAPAIATWFLKLFCSSAEDESLIGDLLEKYQDRGRFWYGRQVIAIVFLRLYRNARQLSLSAAARRMGHVFASPTTTDTGALHPGISISHIPVEGAAGLLFVFGTVFVFGAGVPAVREIFVLTAPLAVLFLGILLYWHKRHSVKIEPLDLHKH